MVKDQNASKVHLITTLDLLVSGIDITPLPPPPLSDPSHGFSSPSPNDPPQDSLPPPPSDPPRHSSPPLTHSPSSPTPCGPSLPPPSDQPLATGLDIVLAMESHDVEILKRELHMQNLEVQPHIMFFHSYL